MRRAVATRRRTYLRKPAPQDGREFVERAIESRDHLEPFVRAPDSAGAYRAWLAQGRRPDAEQFLVCRREDDAVGGFVTLHRITAGSAQSATIGWAGFRPLLGAGHVSDGVDMVLEVAFTQLRLHRIEADVQPANERSRALAVRNGFRLEGYSPELLRIGDTWQDHERWAILEREWRSGRVGGRRA